MNMTRRKRTYFQHLGVAYRAAAAVSPAAPFLSVCLSAVVQRVNRSFIAKWILQKGHAVRQLSLARRSRGTKAGRIAVQSVLGISKCDP